MSKIPQARPLGARLRSDVFADVILWSLTVSPSSLFELRRARFAFGSARLRHAKPKAKRGGARRDRTDDLMLAKHALSQLSYGPNFLRRSARLHPSGFAGHTSLRPTWLRQAQPKAKRGGPGKT